MEVSPHSKAVIIDALIQYKAVLEWEVNEHYHKWRSGDYNMNHTAWIASNPVLVKKYHERQAQWRRKIRDTVNKIHGVAGGLMDELE